MTRSSPFSFASLAPAPASSALGLHALMGDVLDAEAALTAARDRYRAAVTKAGRDTAGCFASCEYISRSTGELWREEGRRAAGAAEKDSDPNDDEIVDDTAKLDEHEPKKKKTRKAKDGTPITDDENEAPAPPTERDPEGKDAAYWGAVNATVRNVLAAHALATGKTPPRADAVYESNLKVYEVEAETGGWFRPSAGMIIAADRKRRGQL